MKKSMSEKIRNWWNGIRTQNETNEIVSYMLKNGADSGVISECTCISVGEVRRIGARFTGTPLIYQQGQSMFD